MRDDWERFTTRQAADLLGLKMSQINDFAKSARLKGRKQNGRWVFRRDQLEEFRAWLLATFPDGKPKGGGSREGAGRPTISPDEPAVERSIRMPPYHWEWYAWLGDGNASQGIRTAAETHPDWPEDEPTEPPIRR